MRPGYPIVAIATSVTTAAAHLADPGADPAVAFTDGFRAAGMTVLASVLALVIALVLLPRPDR